MPTPLGNRVSYGQLEWLWTNAGGPAHMAPIMAAIAEAESRGYPGARNPSGASGLWQILGAPRGMPANSNWFHPEVNARAAVLKWQQQGLGAWTTYTSGVYKKFLQDKFAIDLDAEPKQDEDEPEKPKGKQGGQQQAGQVRAFGRRVS